MYEYNLKKDNIYADLVKVYVDDIFPCNDISTLYPNELTYDLAARRPYYRLRGKSVSPEEAIRIIAKTDTLFSYRYGFEDSIHCCFLNMDYFNDYYYLGHRGWVHPNGIIGQNDSSCIKYPNIDEILEDLVPIAYKFPYLDMIIAVSEWDEISPARFKMLYNRPNPRSIQNDDYYNYNYYDDEDFTENLEMGIWVHNGTIEFVDPKLAAELYEEYDKLYDGIDKRIFFPEYYSDFGMDMIGRDFLRRCLNVYGIGDADGFIEEGKRRGIAFCPQQIK